MTRKELLIQEAARYITRSQPPGSSEAGKATKKPVYAPGELSLMRVSPRAAWDHANTTGIRPPEDIHNILKDHPEFGNAYRKKFGD